MKIDTHNHALPDAAIDLIRANPGSGLEINGDVLTSSYFKIRYDATFSDPAVKLAELERVGLEAAVLSAVPMIFGYELDETLADELSAAVNAGLAQMCATAPDRLRWMASVPMQSPERAAAILQQSATAGCVGVEIATSLMGRYFDDPFFEPFWSRAEELKLPVMIHPAYGQPHPGFDRFYLRNVIGNLLESTVAIERLIGAGVLDDHPGLKILVVHAGGYFPFQAGRLRHAATVRSELAESPPDPWAYRGQVVVDTITHDGPALRYVVERMGLANVVMGTDIPFDMAPAEPMREVLEALGEEDARQVVELNPARLFGFDG
ncbi:MAG: amidohydrolase family protein [Candidatus Dormibacteraceae bacterium]